MIWILIILQMGLIKLGWWVYNSYFMQPQHLHPPVFWDPFTRFVLIFGPSVGIIILITAAFTLTPYFLLFLIFTIVWFGYSGHKNKSRMQKHLMPTLTKDGISMEEFSTEEILEDIRSYNKSKRREK